MSVTQTMTVGPVVEQLLELHRVNLKDYLHKQEGKFVTVDFIKLDGSPRILNGRLGVVKYSNGGPNRTERESNPYLVIFDVKRNGYRTVNLETVRRLRAQHKEFVVHG